jgi:serine/threonine protein kinase
VYLAKHLKTSTLAAIKRIIIVADEDLEEIKKEIEIMKQCDSPYVVQYYGSFFKKEVSEIWVITFSSPPQRS